VEAIKDPKVEMGRNWNRLHSWIALYASRVRLHMGNHGLVHQGCSLHPCQDDIFWSYACRVIHVLDCMSGWSTDVTISNTSDKPPMKEGPRIISKPRMVFPKGGQDITMTISAPTTTVAVNSINRIQI
jgi:hypothetical protein